MREEYPTGDAYSHSENATRRNANEKLKRIRGQRDRLEAERAQLRAEVERLEQRNRELEAAYDQVQARGETLKAKVEQYRARVWWIFQGSNFTAALACRRADNLPEAAIDAAMAQEQEQ